MAAKLTAMMSLVTVMKLTMAVSLRDFAKEVGLLDKRICQISRVAVGSDF